MKHLFLSTLRWLQLCCPMKLGNVYMALWLRLRFAETLYHRKYTNYENKTWCFSSIVYNNNKKKRPSSLHVAYKNNTMSVICLSSMSAIHILRSTLLSYTKAVFSRRGFWCCHSIQYGRIQRALTF